MMKSQPSKKILFGGASAFLVLVFFWLTSSPDYKGPGRWRSRVRPETVPWPARDIWNSTLGFEKILVVGLPYRTDRRDTITLQAALSNLEINFIDGVRGEDMSTKAVPGSGEHEPLRNASIGSWRGHLNAIHEVVRRNLSSALILEDDVDWDIRIREQLLDFAVSTRGLIQPLLGRPDQYADPSYPRPPDKEITELEQELSVFDFTFLPKTEKPSVSPYGDGWDVLWVGHCGMQLPLSSSVKIPKGRVVQSNDYTIPQKDHLWNIVSPFKLHKQYPDHTRLVHHVQEGVCTLGYAVSQRGARRLLQEIALKDMSDPYDILLRFVCEGTHGRNHHTCLTTQPSLFNHYRPKGAYSGDSDIAKHGDGYRAEGYTDMIRWSVRMNADRIMDGEEYVDQFPESEDKKEEEKEEGEGKEEDNETE